MTLTMQLPPTNRAARRGHQFAKVNYTIPEVIEITGWSRNRVYQYIAVGLLRTYKSGKRRFATAAAIGEALDTLEGQA